MKKLSARYIDHAARKAKLEAAMKDALRARDQVLAAVAAAQLRQYRGDARHV